MRFSSFGTFVPNIQFRNRARLLKKVDSGGTKKGAGTTVPLVPKQKSATVPMAQFELDMRTGLYCGYLNLSVLLISLGFRVMSPAPEVISASRDYFRDRAYR